MRLLNAHIFDGYLLGEPHDQGLVFKWGSLVGINMPTIAANGTPFRGAADVAFRPTDFTTAIVTWDNVPYCETDFGDYDNTATDHLAAIHDPTRGIGDICRHMGVIDSANWRMPTAAECDELYRNGLQNGGEVRRIDNNSDWSPGSFAPLHGYAFGPHQIRVAIISNTQVDNADPYINGATFLPASGLHDWDYGRIHWIGAGGYYWSSTVSSINNGYFMSLSSLTVELQDIPRTYGFSVRCIRE